MFKNKTAPDNVLKHAPLSCAKVCPSVLCPFSCLTARGALQSTSEADMGLVATSALATRGQSVVADECTVKHQVHKSDFLGL